ncbi:MAG TPA: putative glycoside hydrolase [Burkholderiales bacterium]|nr:putative glycoside hydrolase [Burkholderiales bacterium]
MALRRLKALLACLALAACAAQAQEFPRLMGMNIGAKHYDDALYQEQLARLDVVVLGFYPGWNPHGYAESSAAAIRKVVQALKARNPRLLVGQYTVLNEANDDPRDVATRDLREKLHKEGWWLRNGAGRRVQWTDRYANWETNFTPWAKPDALGRRWPEWLAERNYAAYFRDVPQFDLVFLDNVIHPLRVKGDWNGDGANDDPKDAKVLAAHFAGHAAHWRRLRELMPGKLLLANVDHDLANPEWRGVLEGAFLEGLMGERWSIESWGGWEAMMRRYRAVLANTRAPHLVGFNVHGDPGDGRFFRYAYASCLLADGYFSFTDKSKGYGSVPWFEEYELELGKAVSPPPDAPWRDGVWRRDFERGVALVNPTGSAKTVALEPGARRLRLAAKDGIVLAR